MKKIFFSQKSHQRFQKYFDIKPSPWFYDEKYIQKTYKYFFYIKWLPWLQFVWIGNSISMNAASKESDIDLFVITTPHTLWFVRIFLTLYFSLLWVRKTNKKHSGRFCLSFFVTTAWLDFSSWRLENDIYLYFWILYLKPILSYNDTYEKFLIANNFWADLSLYEDFIWENKKFIKYSWIKKDFIFLWKIDNFLQKIFLPRTLWSFEKLKKPFWIIISKDILKFHNNDIRKQIIKELIEN